MELHERIKLARKQAGYTQEQASKLLDANRCHLATIEVGKGTPSVRLLASMARVYHVRREWLIDEEGEMQEEDDKIGAVLAGLALEPENPLYKTLIKVAEQYQLLDDRNKKIIDDFIDALNS